MSSILPPARRVWWKEPVEKIELVWIGLAFVWALILFFMMPYWHVFGKQNLSNEAYRISPQQFQAKTQAMVDQYTVRTETDQNVPVVHPPPGSDVYLIARLWSWWPIVELEKGQSYRLHLSAMDYQHGFSPRRMRGRSTPGRSSRPALSTTPAWRAAVWSSCFPLVALSDHCGALGSVRISITPHRM